MLSAHAMNRCRGRAIPLAVVDCLQLYGREVRSRGCSTFYLDKESRRRLEREMGRDVARRWEHKLDVYAVVGDEGTVVTAAYRTRRIKL